MDRGKRKGKAKVDKPLAERKRRARINDALLQLKSIVLQSIKTESTMMSKLEKADILEMTVEYIHKMQQFQGISSANSHFIPGSNVIFVDGSQYTSGFDECTSHVAECISAIPDTDVTNENIKTRLLEHLVSVASTTDLSNKSKLHNIDVDIIERNETAEINSTGTNVMCNVKTYTDANTMPQNTVLNNEHDLSYVNVTETFGTSVNEIQNPVSDGNATYKVFGNVYNDAYSYNYPMYTVFYDRMFNCQGEANSVYESLPNEGGVVSPACIFLPNLQRFEHDAGVTLEDEDPIKQKDIYSKSNVLQREISKASTSDLSCTMEIGVSSIAYEENETKSVLQTKISHKQYDGNDSRKSFQLSEPTVTNNPILFSSLQDNGNSDTGAVLNEKETHAKHFDEASDKAKDSSIMNIPKKRRVLGDFTNFGPQKMNVRTVKDASHADGCKKGVKQPRGKSPRKSIKMSPLKESGKFPKPIKKRISALVIESENITGDFKNENVKMNHLSVHMDSDIEISGTRSIEVRHDLSMSDDYNYKQKSKVNGVNSNSHFHFEDKNAVSAGNVHIEQAQKRCQIEKENINYAGQHSRSTNKLPSIDTFQDLISSKYQIRHASRNRARNYAFPQMKQSNNDQFYQQYFAQNTSENVWRPW